MLEHNVPWKHRCRASPAQEWRVCAGFRESGFYWKPHHRDCVQNTKVLDNEEVKRICGFSKMFALSSNYHPVIKWYKCLWNERQWEGKGQNERYRERYRHGGERETDREAGQTEPRK